MSYTLGQAAKACGRSKMTLARAIKAGRISATRTETGTFAIDPAELHRVYPLASNGAGTMGRDATGEVTGGPAVSLADLLVERDRLVTEQAETIRDLRRRLDLADQRLTTLLVDRRPRGFLGWRRWFR